jgi:hypothetical protein
VEGHDFSRAVTGNNINRALAPEVIKNSKEARRLFGSWARDVARPPGKPVYEPEITLVASGLPTFCALPLAKRSSFA